MTDDEPITTEEWLALHLIRAGKEPSKALPAPKYHDPASKAIKTKGALMHAKADELLQEWWEWSRKYRPHLGVPRIAPYCRESGNVGRQWDDPSDISSDEARRSVMRSVEFCVDSLPTHHSISIGLHMRNRLAQVWRRGEQPENPMDYQFAIVAIIPLMRKECLI